MLNADLKTGNLKVHVAAIPLSRDQLASALLNGKVDLIAAMLTVTPERRALASFSEPTRTNVSEVVVTGPGAPPIASLHDLAGQEVFVREQSLYGESLAKLNEQLKARGKPAVVVTPLPMVLEDDDILEMVNAGLVPITITDDYLAQFWQKVFTGLTVHADVAGRSGGELAVAVRKENPELLAAVNTWIRKHGKGDPFRNTIERRYLSDVKYAKNAASEAERKKFLAVVDLFKKDGAQYDVDYLLMAAQGYQESTLDQNAKSPVGAIGVMQVMPATGQDLKVGDITEIDANVHAGVKGMRFMMDQFYKDDPMDNFNKTVMTFDSYNAGPGRIKQLRRETEKQGLDPNIWIGNVEQVASARIGRETVTYVSNIIKDDVAYKLVIARLATAQCGEGASGEKTVTIRRISVTSLPRVWALALVVCGVLASPARAFAQTDKWEVDVEPLYFWVATTSGNLAINGTKNIPVYMDFADAKSNLAGAFSFHGEARKGAWGVLGDVNFIRLSTDVSYTTPIFSAPIAGTLKLDQIIFNGKVT